MESAPALYCRFKTTELLAQLLPQMPCDIHIMFRCCCCCCCCWFLRGTAALVRLTSTATLSPPSLRRSGRPTTALVGAVWAWWTWWGWWSTRRTSTTPLGR